MNSLSIDIRRISVFSKNTFVYLFLYATIAGFFLRTYLSWQSVNCSMGIMALLVVVQPNKHYIGNRRFGFISVVFSILACVIPVKTLLFFAIGAGVFFVIEQNIGKVNRLSLLLVLFICPFFQFAVNVFSFPIRLWLTEIAGSTLNFIGSDAVVQGSVIACRGQDFLVDTACMGLKMLISSLLLSIVLLSVQEAKVNKRLAWKGLSTFIALVIAFNIVANLIRIIVIVQFAIMPDSLFHEVVGLICFLVYIIIPVWILAKWMLNRVVSNEKKTIAQNIKQPVAAVTNLLLIGLLLVSGLFTEKRMLANRQNTEKLPVIPGYTSEGLPFHTIKLERSGSLIYLKQIEEFFTPDHNPMICWKGSGFELSEVNKQVVAGKPIYMATLRKDAELLYTAWWFDNGIRKTIDQMGFRWDMLRGSPSYTLVNVTCSSKENVLTEIQSIFEKDLLKPLINR